jgi:23S rRNA (adenine-N6)-dimethyltransferase
VAASRRAWGWHALDDRWAQLLVADADIRRGDLVLDIGAGHGAITAALVAAGARVVAIETHPHRLTHLRERFGSEVRVVRADASDLRLPRRPFHVVANPPFAITSALMTRLLHRGSRLVTAHVVLQDAAARRWLRADAPGAGRWQREFGVELGRAVPSHAFRPAPKVRARVLVVRRVSRAAGR